MLPFKKGAFHVALNAEVPVLPVVVSEYDFLGPSRHDQFLGGDITIKILPAINTKDFTKENIDELISETRNSMIGALNRL